MQWPHEGFHGAVCGHRFRTQPLPTRTLHQDRETFYLTNVKRMINASSMREKRRSPRQQTSISYRLAGLFSARQPVVNISRGGCSICSEKPIPVGQVIKIQFFLPQNHTVTATVKVMWCKGSKGNSLGNYRAGLQFVTVSPENLDCLLGLPATPISTPQLQLNKLLRNYPDKTSNTCYS